MPISRLGYVNNGTKKEFPVISALPREMTMAEFALLSDEEKMGDIIVTDYPVNEESDYVEVTGDGVKTYATLFNELFSSLNISKITDNATIESGGDIYHLVTKQSSRLMFTRDRNTTNFYSVTIDLSASSSHYYSSLAQSPSTVSNADSSSSVVPSGTVFRLYYNDAHTFDFNTKAENCIFDPTGTSLSSTNAEDAIKEVDGKTDYSRLFAAGERTYEAALFQLSTSYGVAIFIPVPKTAFSNITVGRMRPAGQSAIYDDSATIEWINDNQCIVWTTSGNFSSYVGKDVSVKLTFTY